MPAKRRQSAPALKRNGSAGSTLHAASFKTSSGAGGSGWKLQNKFGEGIYCNDDLRNTSPPVDARDFFPKRPQSACSTRSKTFNTGSGGAWKMPQAKSCCGIYCNVDLQTTSPPISAPDHFQERTGAKSSHRSNAPIGAAMADYVAFAREGTKEMLQQAADSTWTRSCYPAVRIHRKFVANSDTISCGAQSSPSTRAQSRPQSAPSSGAQSRPQSASNASFRTHSRPQSASTRPQSASTNLGIARAELASSCCESDMTRLLDTTARPGVRVRPSSAPAGPRRPRTFEREPDVRGLAKTVLQDYSSPSLASRPLSSQRRQKQLTENEKLIAAETEKLRAETIKLRAELAWAKTVLQDYSSPSPASRPLCFRSSQKHLAENEKLIAAETEKLRAELASTEQRLELNSKLYKEFAADKNFAVLAKTASRKQRSRAWELWMQKRRHKAQQSLPSRSLHNSGLRKITDGEVQDSTPDATRLGTQTTALISENKPEEEVARKKTKAKTWQNIAKRVSLMSTLINCTKEGEGDDGDDDDDEEAGSECSFHERSHRKSSSSKVHDASGLKSLLPPALPLPDDLEVMLMAGFGRMSDMGQISCEDVVTVLRDADYSHPEPEQDQIDYIVEQMFGGRSFLDQGEYLEFVETYHSRYWCNLNKRFNEADLDGNGSISSAEVSSFLRNVGITPMPSLISDLLGEIMGCADGTKQLRAIDFVKLLDIVEDRAGFSCTMHARLKAIFSRYDVEEQGTVEVKQLFTILSKLGLVLDHEAIEEIIHEVYEEKSTSLTEHNFLHLARQCTERELAEILKAFSSQGCELHQGTVFKDDLPAVLLALGFFTASPQLIDEILDVHMTKEQFVFEDVVLIVHQFRDTEGFSSREREDIKEVYEKFKKQLTNADGLSVLEVLKAVRWFGYPADWESVNEALLQVDVDTGSKFEHKDLLRVLGPFRSSEVRHLRHLFFKGRLGRKSLLKKVAQSGESISAEELSTALTAIGYSTKTEIMTPFFERSGGVSQQVDLWELDALATKFRHEFRDQLRCCQGFGENEVLKWHEVFERHDEKHTGMLSKKPLRETIEEFLPNVTTSMEEHKVALHILEEVDTDHNGEFDFEEFLSMMRRIENYKEIRQVEDDREKFMKERAALTASKFTHAEIKEFRQVFEIHDVDNSKTLDPQEFEAMVAAALQIEAHDLHVEVKNLIAAVDMNNDRLLDFPEFLMVMRKVLDEDWCGINEATARVLVSGEQQLLANFGE